MLCKKALACLAEVALAANKCSQVVTDGVRQKAVVVRGSTAVKKKTRPKRGTEASAGKRVIKKAGPKVDVQKSNVTRAVHNWPCLPLKEGGDGLNRWV